VTEARVAARFAADLFEWFGGFRYVNLGEKLNIVGQGAQEGEQGSYNLRTANHLYGAQLGARLRRSQGSFGWEAAGKAGIFGNDSQQRQSVTDFPDRTLRRANRAAVAELLLSARSISRP
jgi:hypothetical protein